MRLHLLPASSICLAVAPIVAILGIGQAKPQPVLLRGSLPLISQFPAAGAVDVRFLIDRDGRATPELRNSKSPELGRRVMNLLRDWRFDSGPAELPLRIRYRDRPTRTCNVDNNPVVEIHWPDTVDIYEPGIGICETAPDYLPGSVSGSSLRGSVVDESGKSLSGSHLTIRNTSPGSTFVPRTIRSDDLGNFEANNLPLGSYVISVSHSRVFVDLAFDFTVVNEAAPENLTLRLRRVPKVSAWPIGVVRAANVPTYPADALAQGSAGVVRLRLSMVGNVVRDIDASGTNGALVRAARDNVQTWRFDDVIAPVLDVTFTFQVADCRRDGRPKVFMRFPHEVVVIASRLPCGP